MLLSKWAWLYDVVRPRPLRPSALCVYRPINRRPTSQKILGGFLYGVYRPGNDVEFILTVKMATTHPIEGSFHNEFPSVYNHCGIMAA